MFRNALNPEFGYFIQDRSFADSSPVVSQKRVAHASRVSIETTGDESGPFGRFIAEARARSTIGKEIGKASMPEILVRLWRHSWSSVRPYAPPCKPMWNKTLKPYAATLVFFGGKLHGQLLYRKTNGNFEESYSRTCWICRQTWKEKKRRERERKKTGTHARISKVQGKKKSDWVLERQIFLWPPRSRGYTKRNVREIILLSSGATKRWLFPLEVKLFAH